MIKITAKNHQDERSASLAVDGQEDTRWCAASNETPSWLQFQFLSMSVVGAVEIDWEIPGQWMQYTIESSRDGKKWHKDFDGSKNTTADLRKDKVNIKYKKFMRINVLKQQNGMWPSIREIRLYDNTGSKLNLVENK